VLDDVVIARKKKRGRADTPVTVAKRLTLGMRWPVERTNSWLSNFGQLRRNTDKKEHPPARSARSGGDRADHRQADRLAKSLVTDECAYPLSL
jgi:hypothetical protein